MPDDQSPKPPPRRDDPSAGGYRLRDAYEQFCDPELWRQFVEVRPARRSVISPGIDPSPEDTRRAERDRRARVDYGRLKNAVLVDLWNRLTAGEVVAIGHLDSPDNPAKRIPPGEWQYLNINNSGKDGATFEGGGRCWYGVRFHLAADLPAEETAPVVGGRVAVWNDGIDPWPWLASENLDLFGRLGDMGRAVRLGPDDEYLKSVEWRGDNRQAQRLILSAAEGGKWEVGSWGRTANQRHDSLGVVPLAVVDRFIDSIEFWGDVEPTIKIDGIEREFRFFPQGTLPQETSAPAAGVPGTSAAPSATTLEASAPARAEGSQRESGRGVGQPNRKPDIEDVFCTLNEAHQFDSCKNRSAVAKLVWETVRTVVECETELPERLRGTKNFKKGGMMGLKLKTVEGIMKPSVDADPDLCRRFALNRDG